MRIEDPVQRLEAYDAFTASLLPSVDAEGTGKWQVSLDIDDMTDETRRYVILAEEDNRPSYNRVFLVIRDLGQGVEVFINWNDYLADNTTTILRFGSEAAESGYRWSSSSDSTALFLRSSSRSEFLRRLSEVERLVARVTPYNDGPKTAVFDVRRILQALEAAGMQIDGP
jgi:type VI secretion system protein VasI